MTLVLVPLVDGVPLLRFTADDAYISFRYSTNLAGGHGPVWNVVGAHADGYTSPLWMALVAIGDLLGAGLEAWSKVLSLLAAGGIAALLAFAGGRGALLVRAVAIGFLALSPAFMAITVQGFETTTAAFLATATAALLLRAMRRPGLRESLALGAVGMLASFARPDLVPFVLCCFAGLGLWLALDRRFRELGRAAIGIGVAFVLPGLAWAIWHNAYYGYPLPNTSYVKRSTGFVSDESVHLVKGFVTHVSAPFLIALAVLAVRALRRPGARRDPTVWAVGSALVGAGAFLAVGLKFEPIQGDIWRFQMPILGVLLLCLVLLAARDDAVAWLGERGRPAVRVAAVLAGVLVLAYALTTVGEVRKQIRGRWVYDRQEAGYALAPFRRDGLSMLVSESGVLPLRAGWRAYDALGLNDHHIATADDDRPYIAQLNPDLLQFIVATTPGARFRGFYEPFAGLVANGRYRFATATVKTNEELRPGVPPQAHLYFVRAAAPHADAIVTALRGMHHVRLLDRATVDRALQGFGYREPPPS